VRNTRHNAQRNPDRSSETTRLELPEPNQMFRTADGVSVIHKGAASHRTEMKARSVSTIAVGEEVQVEGWCQMVC
jgi:hypothetical protein